MTSFCLGVCLFGMIRVIQLPTYLPTETASLMSQSSVQPEEQRSTNAEVAWGSTVLIPGFSTK